MRRRRPTVRYSRWDGTQVGFELDADTGVVVTLRLHHASSILSRVPGLRLGCELVKADASIERTLQRYIDHTQKRRRLLSLD